LQTGGITPQNDTRYVSKTNTGSHVRGQDETIDIEAVHQVTLLNQCVYFAVTLEANLLSATKTLICNKLISFLL